MKLSSKNRLILVILTGLCAAAYTVRTVLDIIAKEYQAEGSDFLMQVIWNLLWFVIFANQLILYRKLKAEEAQGDEKNL
ncbi:hypothetical protein SAMN02910339_02558 [Lachnospiraceae bacterium YSD2013]|nr:hypothetical protein SAMN02910339_02558 [Lachnospiraceae bacterium YSD2013]